MFSNAIYESWKKIQLEKYEDIFPRIQKYLQNSFKVLDFGIGKAWFEEFLGERDIIFEKIAGFDVNEKAVKPRKQGIEYIIAQKLETDKKFDFIIAFDSLHLIENPLKLLEFAAPRALILIATPQNFASVLEPFNSLEKIEYGEIGETEKDHFILIRNKG